MFGSKKSLKGVASAFSMLFKKIDSRPSFRIDGGMVGDQADIFSTQNRLMFRRKEALDAQLHCCSRQEIWQ